MGLFDIFKKQTANPTPAGKATRESKKTAKEIATAKAEPYVNIDKITLDPQHPGQGGFELDWNEFFVAKLVKSGYQGRDDEQIVDQWFQDVCRNVVFETYEQYAANDTQKIKRNDLGGGRSEFS